MTEKRITIRDVSRASGCSDATVSRVINQNGRFSKETENKVRHAIDELGYKPNQSAKALRMNRTDLVGILVSDLSYEYVSNVVGALEKALFREGILSIVCNTGRYHENELLYLDAVLSMNIRALFVFSSGELIRQPTHRTLPIIYINRPPAVLTDEMSCSVETDDISAGYKAGCALLEAGCRKLAYVGRESSSTSSPRGREVGFMRALWEYNAPYDQQYCIALADNSYLAAFENMNRQVELGFIADGYFCESDIYALGLIHSLEKHHFNVPENVKVIGCNDLSVALYNSRPITTIRHQIEAMCDLAVSNMLLLSGGKTVERRSTVFDVELIKRSTL